MQNSATAWVELGKKGSYAAQLEYNCRNIKDKGTISRRGQTLSKAKKLKGLSEIFECNCKCIICFILFVMQRQVSVGKEKLQFNTEM